jgi:hypothetical protein
LRRSLRNGWCLGGFSWHFHIACHGCSPLTARRFKTFCTSPVARPKYKRPNEFHHLDHQADNFVHNAN